jgi:hypothetical protein
MKVIIKSKIKFIKLKLVRIQYGWSACNLKIQFRKLCIGVFISKTPRDQIRWIVARNKPKTKPVLFLSKIIVHPLFLIF